MKTSKLIPFLAKAIQAKRPVMLVGQPGAAKTAAMEQAAEIAKADLLTVHAVTSDPTDAKGLPFKEKDKGYAEFVPFGDLQKMIEAKKLLVVFLDDFGQAAPAVQASYMQLILARRINGHKVSDHVVFMAATNRRGDKAGVTGILEPVKSRFTSIIHLKIDLEDWVEWAIANKIPQVLISYMRFKPFVDDDFQPTSDLTNGLSPRTVAHLGMLMNDGIIDGQDLTTDGEVIKGCIGEGRGNEFAGFMRIWQDLPDVDDLISNPETADMPKDLNVLHATIGSIVEKAHIDNMSNIVKLGLRFEHEEFQTILLMDCVRKNKLLARNKDYKTWLAKNSKYLV